MEETRELLAIPLDITNNLTLRLAATGFVAEEAGSVASANAVLLRSLVAKGHNVSFCSKPGFVDPRPVLGKQVMSKQFKFVDCTNQITDSLWRRFSFGNRGVWGHALGQLNAYGYNRGLVRAIRKLNDSNLDLWLGDWARGRGDRPVVSFVQGPPGTDARSIFTRRDLIEKCCGRYTWLKLAAAAKWRLGLGLPPFKHSDHIIVGSKWSRHQLIEVSRFNSDRVHAVPYPIDLQAFRLPRKARPASGQLRLFWLGRFAPRKRLDLFLDGMAMAIHEGCNVEAWVVGRSAFAAGFEKLLHEFPYPERLRHWSHVPREDIPGMMSEVDVMVQPSDEENFGSSVAEAMACGVPAIVGATNGTGDYICNHSIRLIDDHPENFAKAIHSFAEMKRTAMLTDGRMTREVAERNFCPKKVTDQLENILRNAVEDRRLSGPIVSDTVEPVVQ